MDAITCLFVTRNCAGLISATLDRVPEEVAVLIADNASTDDTLDRVSETRRPAEIVQMGANAGFARSANRALQNVKTPYALLAMPSAWLTPSALEAFLAAAEAAPDRAIFVPRLVDEFGVPLAEETGPPALPAGDPETSDLATARNLALFVRVSGIQSLSGFDEAFLHFGETEDLCHRAAASGSPARFVPDAEIICPMTAVPGSRPVARQYAHVEWSHAHELTKRLGGEEASRQLDQRYEALERKAMWTALLGPASAKSEYRWRTFGLAAFIEGKSADALQDDLIATQR